MSAILVSPAERDKAILELGKVSSLPEKFGCDLFWVSNGSRWGVQRKAIPDLLASVADGRLSKELMQASAAQVTMAIVIEGQAKFSTDGLLLNAGGYGRPWNKRAWLGMQMTLQRKGVKLLWTKTPKETAECVLAFKAWSEKEKHDSWGGRPGPKGIWGSTPGQKEFGVHVLTSFPGIGADLAAAIWELENRLPLKLDIEPSRLLEAKGMGKKRVANLLRVLGDEDGE